MSVCTNVWYLTLLLSLCFLHQTTAQPDLDVSDAKETPTITDIDLIVGKFTMIQGNKTLDEKRKSEWRSVKSDLKKWKSSQAIQQAHASLRNTLRQESVHVNNGLTQNPKKSILGLGTTGGGFANILETHGQPKFIPLDSPVVGAYM